MVLPLGLGHKHIKISLVSVLFFTCLGWSYFQAGLVEPHLLRLLISAILFLAMAPYVEMRMGTFLTLIGTACFGLISGKLLNFSEYYFHPFMAASWLTGAYFSLFYFKEFKLGIWRIFDWKYLTFESSFFVPFLYIFAWWGFIFSVKFDQTFFIQNLYPLGSFVIGAIIGYSYRRFRPVPMGFLYEFEWLSWKNLVNKNVNTKKLAIAAQYILDFNPTNMKVQYDICKRIAIDLRSQTIHDKLLNNFFNKQLNLLLDHLAKENKLESGLSLLSSLPIKNSFQKVFTKISSQNLYIYARAAEKNALNILAITLYSAFVEKNPKSIKIRKVLKSLDYLLEAEIEDQSYIDDLQFLESNLVVPELSNLYQQHFQFSRTAVITAVHKKPS